MYVGRSSEVKVPGSTDNSKIVIASTGYVYYQTAYEWDSEKRQPIYKRCSIGRIKENSNNSVMYPNKNFFKFFGEQEDVKLSKLKAVFSSSTRKEAGKVDNHIAYGGYVLISAIARKTGCYEILKKVFPKHYKLILALCTYGVSEGDLISQQFSSWCFGHYCGLDRTVSDSEVSALYTELSKNSGDIQIFFSLFAEMYEKLFPSPKTRIVAFDSTNQNTSSGHIDFAKFGQAKINVDLPIINTAAFVDETTGIPLWYEHFDGSVLDKTQTPYSLKKILNLGYKKLFVVFDRGYYSEDAIKQMQQLELEFGVLCPESTNWVEELISTKGNEIKDQQKYYLAEENVYGNVYQVKLKETQYYAYMFYDSKRAEDERQALHSLMAFYWENISKHVRYSEQLEKYAAKRGVIIAPSETTKDGKNFIMMENTEMIQQLLNHKGFFVMLSPSKIEPYEAISIIRKRDNVEKNFSNLMRGLNLRTTYRHNANTYVGLMFVAFIAQIIMAGMLHFEKTFLNSKTSMTTNRIIAELNKYCIDQNEDDTWYPSYAMNKDQKEILSNVGITEDDVHKFITKIASGH